MFQLLVAVAVVAGLPARFVVPDGTSMAPAFAVLDAAKSTPSGMIARELAVDATCEPPVRPACPVLQHAPTRGHGALGHARAMTDL